MTKRISLKKSLALALLGWMAVSGGYAYYYVKSRLDIPDLVGYESEWQFQLFIFCVFRLPFLLIFLGATIWFLFRRDKVKI